MDSVPLYRLLALLNLKIKSSFKVLYYLNFEIVFGSVACSFFLSQIYQQDISKLALLSLGLGVFTIYLTDHLLDTVRYKINLGSPKKQWVLNHQKWLFFLLGILALVQCFLLCFLPLVILKYGVILVILVACYFLITRYVPLLKEFGASLLYCLGILAPFFNEPFIPEFLMNPGPWLSIGFLVLSNILLCSLHDSNTDRQNHENTLAVTLGKRAIKLMIYSLLSLMAIVILVQYYSSKLNTLALFIYLSMLALFIIIMFFWEKNPKHFISRFYLDGVLILPALVLFKTLRDL